MYDKSIPSRCFFQGRFIEPSDTESMTNQRLLVTVGCVGHPCLKRGRPSTYATNRGSSRSTFTAVGCNRVPNVEHSRIQNVFNSPNKFPCIERSSLQTGRTPTDFSSFIVPSSFLARNTLVCQRHEEEPNKGRQCISI